MSSEIWTTADAENADWRANLSPHLPTLGATVVAGALLLVALVGPAWLHVPANPQVGAPAANLDFDQLGDLIAADAVPTNGIQAAYFSWLGWLLATFTVLTGLVASVLPRRAVAGTLTVLAIVGLVLTGLAVKGPLSWSDFLDQVPNVRAGGYLVVLGYLLLLVTGVFVGRRRAL